MSEGHYLEWEKQEETAKIYERDRGKAKALSRNQPLYSPSADKSKCLSLFPLSVVFAGRSALCQDIMPSLSTHPHQGLSSGNRWGRRPFPCPSKLLKAAHWEPTSTSRPSRKPPTPGKVPALHTHLIQEVNLALFTSFISPPRLSVFSLSGSREDEWLSAMPSSTEGADLP